MSPSRIPFDSLCLAAALAEAQALVGGRVQKVVQPDPLSFALEVYGAGQAQWLHVSCDPEFARFWIGTDKPKGLIPLPQLGEALKARIVGGRLTRAWQRGFDRIAEFEFESSAGRHTLVAELMGKHANAMLLSCENRVIAAAKWIGPNKSKRPITPGASYAPPPFPPKTSILEAKTWEQWADSEGGSPFLKRLLLSRANLEAGSDSQGDLPPALLDELERLAEVVRTGKFAPVYVAGHGAYPTDISALDLKGVRHTSYCQALERFLWIDLPARELQRRKAHLEARLNRVLLARETALSDLREQARAGERASEFQALGQLVLAYASQIPPGSDSVDLVGFDGETVRVRLDSDLSAIENANLLFEKARKAKERAPHLLSHSKRLAADGEALREALLRVEGASSESELRRVEEEATQRRWIIVAALPTRQEDRPFEGHRIRELIGPKNVRILYGENAQANDYLTLRVAKPDDWWLHVRGDVSAHVVIPTQRKPDSIPHEALLFAAQIAAKSSPQKHSSMVAVDCALRKYVRKQKGAPAGTVVYTHERTFHVSPRQAD